MQSVNLTSVGLEKGLPTRTHKIPTAIRIPNAITRAWVNTDVCFFPSAPADGATWSDHSWPFQYRCVPGIVVSGYQPAGVGSLVHFCPSQYR